MPRPTRILHFVDNLGKGGLENGLANLIERMDPGRFEHFVCAIRRLGPTAERLRAAGARVLCLNIQASSRFQVLALQRTIREIDPDVVHSRNWSAIEAVLAGKFARSRGVVHSEHGLEADTSIREPWRRTCFRRLAFELADRVLSVSHQLRDLHARRTGFAARRITVIHNGVDIRRFQPSSAVRARVREELGLSQETFCIGCVGNLTPVKDYPTALRGVEAFSLGCSNWRLIVIGEGPERGKLEELVHANPQMRERVKFLGLSHRVPEMLAAMDVYLLSSVIEGVSNSLLEAMATGLPVIATAVGGNPEVVVDGESGLLFPAGDFRQLAERLSSLYRQQDLRSRIAQRARRRVQEEFSIDSMVRGYEDVYEGFRATVPLRTAVAV
jgi:sugar transferase (PEP-CTERM/EpsH1 system associated)